MRKRIVIVFGVLVGGSCAVLLASWALVLKNSSETLKQAAVALEMGEPQRARDELKWLLWFDSDNPAAHRMVGLTYLREKNLRAAIHHLEQIPEDSSLHEESQIDLAASLLADRQWDRAEEVLRSHVVRYPASLIAVRQLSGLLLAELRRREAIPVLEGFLQRSQERLDFEDRLTILRDLSLAETYPLPPEACLPSLQEAIQRDANQTQVQVALARCYWAGGKRKEAESYLQQAHATAPQNWMIRFVLCEFRLDQNDWKSAETILLQHTENVSEVERDDRYWQLQGRIAEQQGNYERALQSIERALALQPYDRDYEARRARLLQRLGKPEAATEAYARSHELGRAELDLWKLSRDVGVRRPTAAEANKIAEIYESFGKPIQAAVWRQLGEQIESGLYTPSGQD